MNAIQQIFQAHGEDFCRELGATVQQRKAIAAIANCRTPEFGIVRYSCPTCPHELTTFRSCGNRHCPTCDGRKSHAWLSKQLQRRLPCEYFLLTFTIPAELRSLVLGRRGVAYGILMDAAANALKAILKDPRHCGAEFPGFTCVLHTWGRQLQFHPHVHVIIPAGGLNADRDLWMSSRDAYLAPVQALSRLFRGKCIAGLEAAGLTEQIPTDARRKEWNVHCKPAGSGANALKYLARYVFRIAISPERIIAVTDTTVTFSYKKVNASRSRTLSLSIFEFMRRYLMHVLPMGFMKIRHYGFMHPNSSVDFDDIRELVAESKDLIDGQVAVDLKLLLPPPPLCCPCCKTPLVCVPSIPLTTANKLAKGLPMKAG